MKGNEMSGISIIGGAIAGPAAALALAREGHSVTVYEQRPANALFSAGILGMTHGNWSLLTIAGADLYRFELPGRFRDYNTDAVSRSPYRLITWTGLHKSLVAASMEAGVKYE